MKYIVFILCAIFPLLLLLFINNAIFSLILSLLGVCLSIIVFFQNFLKKPLKDRGQKYLVKGIRRNYYVTNLLSGPTFISLNIFLIITGTIGGEWYNYLYLILLIFVGISLIKVEVVNKTE